MENRPNTEEMSFECYLCQKKFRLKVLLTNHFIKVHTREKSFECTLCLKKFAQNDHLSQHLKSHTSEKPFECTFCPKKYRDKRDLTYHMGVHTGENPFQCGLCLKKFTRKNSLSYHLKLQHTAEKPLECTYCRTKFTTKSNLAMHIRTHAGEKLFECTICQKKFSSNTNLKVHGRRHTGEKPFECGFCHKKFRTKSNLTIHMKTHTGEKPFECTICSRKYAVKGGLALHMRAHAGEKPFECTLCYKRFVQNSNLSRHLKSHNGEKPFECTLCPKKYVDKITLTKHMKRVHTGPFESIECPASEHELIHHEESVDCASTETIEHKIKIEEMELGVPDSFLEIKNSDDNKNDKIPLVRSDIGARKVEKESEIEIEYHHLPVKIKKEDNEESVDYALTETIEHKIKIEQMELGVPDSFLEIKNSDDNKNDKIPLVRSDIGARTVNKESEIEIEYHHLPVKIKKEDTEESVDCASTETFEHKIKIEEMELGVPDSFMEIKNSSDNKNDKISISEK